MQAHLITHTALRRSPQDGRCRHGVHVRAVRRRVHHGADGRLVPGKVAAGDPRRAGAHVAGDIIPGGINPDEF